MQVAAGPLLVLHVQVASFQIRMAWVSVSHASKGIINLIRAFDLVGNAEQVGTLPPPALNLVVSVHRASTKINQGRVLVMTAR